MSGGGDSLGLLKLAADRADRPLHAATVDHGLRAEAAREADGVAALCRSLNVPHTTLRPGRPLGLRNVQATARRARYAVLARWADALGVACVATAHQMDDQAETLAMRFARGSGLHGLSGVRPRLVMTGPDRPPLTVIRPCLTLRRAELAAMVAEAGWQAVFDPANTDERYDRARMRRLLPPAAVPGLMRSAAALAQASEALRWAEGQAAALALNEELGRVMIDPAGLPPALQRALLARAVHRLAPDAAPPTGPEGDRLLAALAEGRIATLRGLRFTGGSVWTVAPARPSPDCKSAPAPYLSTTTF